LFFPSTFKYCFQFKNVFFTAGTEAQDPLCHLLAVTMPLLTASSPTVYLKASFVGNWCDHFWLLLYSSSSPRIYQKTSTPLTSPHAIIKQKKNSLILHKKKKPRDIRSLYYIKNMKIQKRFLNISCLVFFSSMRIIILCNKMRKYHFTPECVLNLLVIEWQNCKFNVDWSVPR